MKHATFPSSQPDRIVGPREVETAPGRPGLVPYTNQHLLRLERAGHFPKRFPLYPGSRLVGWRLSDILAWINSRAENANCRPARPWFNLS